MSRWRPTPPIWIAALALCGAGLYVATHLQLSTGLDALLVESEDQQLAQISSRLVDSPLTRTMVFAVRGEDLDAGLAVSDRFVAALLDHPEVERIRDRPDPELFEQLSALYYPRRFALLSDRPEQEIPERTSDAGLQQTAERIRDLLSLPQAAVIRDTLGGDPLLAYYDLLLRLRGLADEGLGSERGRFVDTTDDTVLFFLTTRHSAFDARQQTPFEAAIPELFEAAKAAAGRDATYERSAVHRFAAAAQNRGMVEMQTLSTISIAGIVLLFLWLFRSPTPLLLALLPLTGGVLGATAIGLLLFGELHVMTTAFGATLIGICIDYPVHLIVHHRLLTAPEGDPRKSILRIWSALRLGAFTTIAGFLGLTASNFPGIREIGAFSVSGIAIALAMTRWVLPELMPRKTTPSSAERHAARSLARGLDSLGSHRRLLGLGLTAALGVMVWGLASLRFEDDVYGLNMAPPAEWLAEEGRVRARIGQVDAGRLVLTLGGSEAEALARNDRVFERLEDAVDAGEIGGFRSIHPFLPSPDLQQRNLEVLLAQPRLVERVGAALDAAGFDPDAFVEFERAVAAARSTPPAGSEIEGPGFSPLEGRELLATPLADLVAGFLVPLDDGVAILSMLREVALPDALRERLSDLPGVLYFDQQQFIADVYEGYRRRTVGLIGVGLLGVLGLLFWRHRSLAWMLACASPALLSAALTLAILSLAGVAINLLHLLGVLLVLSMGVDYAIFLITPGADPDERAAAMLTLLVACASTCLGFGLLALSAFPALQAVGTSTAIGVILSLLLAPTALTLVEGRRGSPLPRQDDR